MAMIGKYVPWDSMHGEVNWHRTDLRLVDDALAGLCAVIEQQASGHWSFRKIPGSIDDTGNIATEFLYTFFFENRADTGLVLNYRR
jgi:hypothetical protein